MELEPQQSGLNNKKPFYKNWRTMITGSLIAAIVLVVVVLVGLLVWFNNSIQPVEKSSSHSQTIRFEVKSGESPKQIANNLKSKKLIKSPTAFQLYVQKEGKQANLIAETYALKNTMSVSEIVEHLSGGKFDYFNLRILPEKTLDELRGDFRKYGYSDKEITAALESTYSGPLFANRPAGSDLEGFIFPETFEVQSNGNLSDLLKRDFKTFYQKIEADGTIEALSKQNLNLFQALTLASIIQKEASNPKDQPQIAQVFLKRLRENKKLESDVTFHYAAKKLKIRPNVNLDSPYNTRLYPGLPPGPISNFNYSALQSVAHPAEGDYEFFIAGDDGVIYYAKTYTEHEKNIENHCKILCGKDY